MAVTLAVLLVGLVTVVTIARSDPGSPVISASSHDGRYPLNDLASEASATRELRWLSAGETTGASVTVTWQSEVAVGRVDIRAAADPTLAPKDGFLTFSDGSSLNVRFDYHGDFVASFHTRRVQWARLTVSATEQPTASAVGLASMNFTNENPLPLPDTTRDDAGVSRATASSSASPTVPGAVVDGGGGAADLGASWRSAGAGPQWIDIRWRDPRELSSVQIYGSPDQEGQISSGTLEFGDGTTIAIGGVLPGGAAPTTVAFMPKITDSVRFWMQAPGPVGLREFTVLDAGRPPVTPRAATGISLPLPQQGRCDVPATPAAAMPAPRLVCPITGSAVGERVRIVVAAQPAASIDATAWSAEANGGGGGVESVGRTTVGQNGYGELDLDARKLLRGPATIRLDVSGTPKPLYVQIANPRGTRQPDDSPPQGGMTTAWEDEFRSPLSISQSGRGTLYAATKPSHNGPSEFGSAVFADPAWNTNTIGTVDDDYLRIRLNDLPAGRIDPLNWGRTHLGGILSSAAIGGSGFSAQYGYFEARILGAPGEGSWPAFWALSGQSLVDPGKPTGELDVVELYGHDNRSTCHSVHSWSGGEDTAPITRCVKSNGVSDWALEWHTYGARITPTATHYYIDGVEVATSPVPVAAAEPFYFMLDLSAGGGWPVDLSGTGGTSDLYVDYVRVLV